MRHATVLSLEKVHQWLSDDATDFAMRKACDWEEAGISCFGALNALGLLGGEKEELPTCPSCAALLDLALELRGGYQTKED